MAPMRHSGDMTPRETAEREAIVAALNAVNGDIERAARLLTEQGRPMSERTLYRRIDQYRLRPRVTYEAA